MSGSSSRPVIIIGAGLFGSIAAALVHRRLGRKVYVIDDDRPGRGSKPAACLIRPSWIAGLGAKGKLGLDVLRELYGLREIVFKVGPTKVTVQHVSPSTIRYVAMEAAEWRNGTVHAVSPNGEVATSFGTFEKADVLNATGVWSSMLMVMQAPRMPVVRALAGVAFIYNGVRPPQISMWAPYKQIVAFQRDPRQTWIGDGSAIIEKNWDQSREQQSLVRCRRLAPKPVQLLGQEFGLRPYVVGHKQGYFAQQSDSVWVSTGGAKNGTVLAAAQAAMFVEELRKR